MASRLKRRRAIALNKKLGLEPVFADCEGWMLVLFRRLAWRLSGSSAGLGEAVRYG